MFYYIGECVAGIFLKRLPTILTNCSGASSEPGVFCARNFSTRTHPSIPASLPPSMRACSMQPSYLSSLWLVILVHACTPRTSCFERQPACPETRATPPADGAMGKPACRDFEELTGGRSESLRRGLGGKALALASCQRRFDYVEV